MNKDKNYKPEFDEQGREIFPLNVTFLAMIYLYGELIVTGGDDGYVSFFPLYFWSTLILHANL
jgi:hypothetical protein